MSNSISKITNPMVNGFQHGWSHIKVIIGTTTISTAQSITYSDNVGWENIYGAGNAPIGRGRSNYEATAKISMLKSDVDALIRAVKLEFPDSITNSLSDLLPFDIIVMYTADLGAGAIHTDIIKNCQFMNTPVTSSQGDASITMDLDLICSHIVWHTPL